MPVNKTKSERRAQRRRRVAQLLVRRPRITVREMRQVLFRDGHLNPKTENPWSVRTVQKDIEAVREEARKEMKESAEEWRAKELRRLRQLQQEAWDDGDHNLVLRCMKRRSKMLGLDAPERKQIGGDPNSPPIQMQSDTKLSDAELARIAAEAETHTNGETE